jgi:hypothetical protein
MTQATVNPSEWSVRYPHPASIATVRYDVPFSTEPNSARLMDIYTVAPIRAALPGAILIATGYPAAGLKLHFGRAARGFGSARSWAALFAAQGVAAITYDAVDPANDLPLLAEFLKQNGRSLGIDPTRLGVFACSGNVPVVLADVAGTLRCAALLYGFMVDAPGHTSVADAARQFGFAIPKRPLLAGSMPDSIAMLIVRAGRDTFAGVNQSIDAFACSALHHNLALTLINHAGGAHAFDLLEEGKSTRDIIERVLSFVSIELGDTE